MDIDKFTYEDQKYVACHNEEKQLNENKFSSGSAKYDYIFVDEFQDINFLDLRLIKVIAKRNHATLTIIGDDDQAIFEWRGASSKYILSPNQFFDLSFEKYKLAVNYRSPKNIIEHSQRLIENNSNRVRKEISSTISEEANIEVHKITGGFTENLKLVQKILGDSHDQTTHVAIIGRKRSQLIPYQIHFVSRDIPFCCIAEDLLIFRSQAFDNLLKLLLIKKKANNEQNKSRINADLLLLCRFVSRYGLNQEKQRHLREYLNESSYQTVNQAINVLYDYDEDIATRLQEFVDTDTVSEALLKLGEHFEGLKYDFQKAENDIFYAGPPFSHLAEYAHSYKRDYEKFVSDIENAKSTLAHVDREGEDGQQQLHLMTATRAKGKEFHTVVLLDVINGIWPSNRAETQDQIEAERRLFYVAFTRAKRRVIMLLNKMNPPSPYIPSPYIEELRLPEESFKSEPLQIMSIRKSLA